MVTDDEKRELIAVAREHRENRILCARCSAMWPCLPRRLADALEGTLTEPGCGGTVRQVDREELAEVMFDAYRAGHGKPWAEEGRGVRGLYLEQADAAIRHLRRVSGNEY